MKIKPELVLRIGLAGTFLYAGLNSILNPTSWIGFIPQWINSIPLLTRELFLTIHGMFEIILAIALLVGIYKKLAALLAFLSIGVIVIFSGIDDVTFRDFGLLGASYALMLLYRKKIDKPNSMS
ncbi:hypothetical protein CL629_04740 [bacterium]|nr:hypothetical protein [bacterium]|tara:strand:- start:1746 stop:2117 length:372 start_codon:yes stop_codon:yes gene_type:complete